MDKVSPFGRATPDSSVKQRSSWPFPRGPLPIRACRCRFGIVLRPITRKRGERFTHPGNCDGHGVTSIGTAVATSLLKEHAHVESWTRSPHRGEGSLSWDRQPGTRNGFHGVSSCLDQVPCPNRDGYAHECLGFDVFVLDAHTGSQRHDRKRRAKETRRYWHRPFQPVASPADSVFRFRPRRFTERVAPPGGPPMPKPD